MKEVACLLRYTTEYWVSHLHRVYENIPPSNPSYYHGLCHLRFPDFLPWLGLHEVQNREIHRICFNRHYTNY